MTAVGMCVSFVSPPVNLTFRYGLDLVCGKIVNNLSVGVLEPKVSKVKMLKFATEAAITILRIDDMVRLNPTQESPTGDGCRD